MHDSIQTEGDDALSDLLLNVSHLNEEKTAVRGNNDALLQTKYSLFTPKSIKRGRLSTRDKGFSSQCTDAFSLTSDEAFALGTKIRSYVHQTRQTESLRQMRTGAPRAFSKTSRIT